MASPEFHALLDQADRTQKLLWGVLTLSIVLYAVVAFVAVPGAPDPTLAETLRVPFWVAAAALAATSLLLSRRQPPPFTPGAQPPPAGSSPLLRKDLANLAPEERRALTEVGRSFIPWMVCLIMNEAVAILGLVLAFLAGGPEQVVPFVVLAIALNLMMRPDARRRAAAALGRVAP